MGLGIHHVVVGLALFCILFIRCGVLGIWCWECNSEYDPRCADPFRNYSFTLTDCDQRFLFHYPKQNSTVCRKMVQKVKGNYRYIRTCGFLEDQRTNCYRRAGTFDVQIEFCQCNTDGCNHAAPTSAHSAVAILTAILLFSVYHFHTPWID